MIQDSVVQWPPLKRQQRSIRKIWRTPWSTMNAFLRILKGHLQRMEWEKIILRVSLQGLTGIFNETVIIGMLEVYD